MSIGKGVGKLSQASWRVIWQYILKATSGNVGSHSWAIKVGVPIAALFLILMPTAYTQTAYQEQLIKIRLTCAEHEVKHAVY